ncbi:hypothetical protein OQA88_107 [Cercophora sp. LCS_1]
MSFSETKPVEATSVDVDSQNAMGDFLAACGWGQAKPSILKNDSSDATQQQSATESGKARGDNGEISIQQKIPATFGSKSNSRTTATRYPASSSVVTHPKSSVTNNNPTQPPTSPPSLVSTKTKHAVPPHQDQGNPMAADKGEQSIPWAAKPTRTHGWRVSPEPSLTTLRSRGPGGSGLAVRDDEHAPREKENQHKVTECEPSDCLSTGADILSLADSASLPSVDIVTRRPPVPAKYGRGYDSPVPTASGLSVSSFHGTEDDECRCMVQPDFRGIHGPECDIIAYGNMWVKQNGLSSEGKDYYDPFHEGPLFEAYICAWIDQIIPNETKLDVKKVAKHWNSQVDTSTNTLVMPMNHPDTFPRQSEPRWGLDWRRQTWTTSLHVGREADKQRRANQASITSKPAEVVKKGHLPPTFWDPEKDPEFLKIRQAEKEARERAEAALLPLYSLCSPRTPAYLRPAKLEDMAQITEIYSWEVENGTQGLDAEPLTKENFVAIFKQAEGLGMPFLVAAYGSAKSLNIRNNTSYYTKCTPHPDATVTPNPTLVGKIIGFAYLSVWAPGLAGSVNGSSRASAQVNLYVHAEFRRKRIGFCLLDRLLMTVSERYSTASSYDFVDPKDRKMYQYVEENKRKFWRIYLNYLVKHDRDGKASNNGEIEGIRRILTETFNFSEKCRFEMSHRTPNSRPGPVYWLDSLTFEHGCFLGEKIWGAEKY